MAHAALNRFVFCNSGRRHASLRLGADHGGHGDTQSGLHSLPEQQVQDLHPQSLLLLVQAQLEQVQLLVSVEDMIRFVVPGAG